MKNSKIIALFLVIIMLFTVGCTGNGGDELPAYTEEIIENEPSTTYLPRPLSNNDDGDDGSQNACVQIEQGSTSELNTILPLVNADFEDAEAMKDTKWSRIGNSVQMEITEDGFSGNGLKFTKDASKDASFHSAFIDFKPYVKNAGTYTLRMKFKVVGSDGTSNAFAGVVRTDSKDKYSFCPEGKDFKGTGTVGVIDDDVWYLYTASLTISAEDVLTEKGSWRFGLQSIQEGIETVYIDEVEIFETSYDEEPKAVTEAQTWVANEVVLLSSKTYADPFNDVDVDLELTNGKVTYLIPGFWDGGNTWRVRFVCTEEGQWTYKTICTDSENAGLHNQTSTVNCNKYVGNLEVYKHGFVTTDPEKKYFVYADGTPFFYLGDTHWALGGETVDMVKEIVKTRAEQGYNVYQSEPINASYNFIDGVTNADIAGLKVYDEKFKTIASYGLTHVNAAHFFTSNMAEYIEKNGGYSDTVLGYGTKKGTMYPFYDISDTTKANLEKISRYWVARYSAYPVMWTLAQECDNDFFWEQKSDFHGHEKWGVANNPYVYVAEYFGKHDPYKHPLTAHQEGSSYTKASNSAFREVEAHTWYASQWNPKVTGESIVESPTDYWLNGQGKPTIRYESYYWMVQTKDFGARARSWMSILSGMAGVGYGAQGGWYYGGSYQANREEDDGVDTITVEEKAAHKSDWKGALQAESSIQVTYMRNFFENRVGDWYNLIPRFDDTEYLERDLGAYAVMASNEDNSKAVIYFYNFSDTTLAQKPNAEHSGTMTGTVKKLEAGARYEFLWFNPVTGKAVKKGSFLADELGQWKIPEKETCDMVLYISKVQ